MALTPISSSIAPTRVQPVEGGAARAAQRAFFNAALGNVGAPAPSQPVAAVAPTAAPQQAHRQIQTQAPAQTDAPETTRPYRPGSRLDIRV